MIIKLKDITLRKLFWIVLHCLINDSCLYTVQFGDITVEDDLLVAQGDDFFFYLRKQISFHSFKI